MLCNEFHQLTNGIMTSKSSSVCISQDVLDQIQGEDDISLSDDESIEISDFDGGEASGLDSKLSDTQMVTICYQWYNIHQAIFHMVTYPTKPQNEVIHPHLG